MSYIWGKKLESFTFIRMINLATDFFGQVAD